MDWQKVLKMPMAFNVDEQRDEQYKQQIVEFEKNKIEPALTKFYQSAEAGVTPMVKIIYGSGTESKVRFANDRGLTYMISIGDLKQLGGNKLFVLKTIGELYEKEGFRVELKDDAKGDYLIITK